MNITPIIKDNIAPYARGPDPLVTDTIKGYPGLETRIVYFVSGKDMAALSAPGMIFLNDIESSNGSLFK